ncbi:MAG: glycosyltransferase family 4 protein [Bacteroidaceae bacterium]|nr:glycosyltransferase family 4 protein [Bacteroidaceae bacterium]
MKNIVCFHLFNDHSGSPQVLRTVVEGLLERGYHIDLVTSRGGVLDELEGKENLRLKQYNYKFARNVAVRAVRYVWVQLQVFFIALGYIFKKETVIYINTILPVGAAIGGRLAGKNVVYHYHENAKAKSTAYRILAKIMQLIAGDIICVSQYQRSFLRRKKRVYIVPNALQNHIAAKLTPDSDRAFEQQRILMLGSLKTYKGTDEFIALARGMNKYRFELVINDSQENIDNYLRDRNITQPPNLTIYPRQEDVTPFYNRASLVLNLSNKKQFIETFGLTALEAMTAGLPVIVPTVGGIAEMVTDGENGFKIDSQDCEEVKKCIENILRNKDVFVNLSNNALAKSRLYDAKHMVDNIANIL